MSADPGVGFWLSYVEQQGGLVEAVPGGALAVLPEPVQARFGLAETVTVTGDPETAREDGALLLAAGHPVLTVAAEAVLSVGDVGVQAVSWPADQVPAGPDLLEQARDTFSVDHGRIDRGGPPFRRYLPVLRAGGMISYTIAGDEAYQERVECWLDAETGRELPDVLRAALESSSPDARDTTAVLAHDLRSATRIAHQVISTRAAARLKALDGDAHGARATELARTSAYYREVLEGIERRRANTAPDRLAALDARVAATRAEEARRLGEIRDKHRARLEVKPYRLHLVLVPAVVLPVDVMRGSRRYPQHLVWVWPARRFRALPCPSCGADRPLVAGKAGLGCQACLTRPAEPRETIEKPATKAAAVEKPAAKAGPPLAKAVAQQAAPSPRPTGASLRAMGEDLFVSLWTSVARADRIIEHKLLADSPAHTCLRLFGVAGLAAAVGVPPSDRLESVAGRTRPPGAGTRFVTQGEVMTRSRVRYQAAMVWRLDGARPMIDEILPVAAHDLNLLRAGLLGGDLVMNRLPPSIVTLDAVAARLVKVILPGEGLPLLIRCLTGWWRLALHPAAIGEAPSVTAAALLRLVSWRSGHRVSTADCAVRFGVEEARIRAAEAVLKAGLKLGPDVRW